MRVTAIELYPLKSTAARGVLAAGVAPTGLVGDREWMVIDSDGELLSARKAHRLFAITATNRAIEPGLQAQLRLSAPGLEDLSLDRPEGSATEFTKFRRPVLGVLAGPAAQEWLAEALGVRGARLVWSPPADRRAIAFQDATPVTLLTDASLGRLDGWLRETAADAGEPEPPPLPYRRFRPNVYVEGGLVPFAEDDWSAVRIGAVEFRAGGPVSRCVMTTLDAETLQTGKEPIRTLARHRRWDAQTWMCASLTPLDSGTIRVGDAVVPLE